MNAEKQTVKSILGELKKEKKIQLGHFGTLRMNADNDVYLDVPCMASAKPVSLSEKEIIGVIQRFLDYEPPKSENKRNSVKKVSFDKLMGMV